MYVWSGKTFHSVCDCLDLYNRIKFYGNVNASLAFVIKHVDHLIGIRDTVLCPLVTPHGFHKHLPRCVIFHPVPNQVSLPASSPCLPELSLQYWHCFCCANHDNRQAYGIDKRHKEVQHLIRASPLCFAQMLYLINHKDAYLELPYKLCHDNQKHVQGVSPLGILLKIIRSCRQIQCIKELVAQLF